MKTFKKIAAFLLICLSITSCEKDEKNLIDVKIVEKDGLENMTFLPNMEFKEVKDSSYQLFDEKDYYRIMVNEIKVAPPIFQNDKIKVRIFTRTSYNEDRNEFEFLVRTYSKDGKIKDEMVMASTVGNLKCEGKVTADLKIITSCPDGEKAIAQIEFDGSIKLIENE